MLLYALLALLVNGCDTEIPRMSCVDSRGYRYETRCMAKSKAMVADIANPKRE